jgi:hypothetical protein
MNEKTPTRGNDRWPNGTIFLMILFLMLLAGMWSAVYFMLLNR